MPPWVETCAGAAQATPATPATIATTAATSRGPTVSPSIRSPRTSSRSSPTASTGWTAVSGASTSARRWNGHPDPASSVPASQRRLRAGTFHGVAGQYRAIQSAVDAAKEGDWILIGPGDYHERADYSRRHHATGNEPGAAVLIEKNGLHLRGMNRDRVIVDGTKPGS